MLALHQRLQAGLGPAEALASLRANVVASTFHLWTRSRLPTTPEEARDPSVARQLRELTFFLLCHGVVLAPSGLGCLATTTRDIDVDYLLAAVEYYLPQ
jgi:hypothetical protein